MSCQRNGVDITSPLYLDKGNKNACSSYRGASLLSMPGNIQKCKHFDIPANVTEGAIVRSNFIKEWPCQLDFCHKMAIKYVIIKRKRKIYMLLLWILRMHSVGCRGALWHALGTLTRRSCFVYKKLSACVGRCHY